MTVPKLMTCECPTCGFKGVPLSHCAVCGTLIPVTPQQATLPGLTPPLSAEIDSLRAQLSVARAQTASDRELIVELRRATEACVLELDRYESTIDNGTRIVRADARAVLGKVAQ